MAKVRFAFPVEALQGLIGSAAVFNPRQDILGFDGRAASGIVRILGNHSSNHQRLLNIRKAFTICAVKWGTVLSPTEQETWNGTAVTIQESNGYAYSGFTLFIAYHMSLYASMFSSDFSPTDLTNATSWQFNDRASSVWT